MMLKKSLGAAAAAMLAAGPCLAAELPQFRDSGVRQSGAVAGAYFKVPLGGAKSGKAAAGLRMTMVHDYRSASGASAQLVQSDSFDLRLVGEKKPTLFVAGQAVTGEEAKKRNLTGAGTVVTIVIIAAAAVGGYYLWRAIDDSGEE
jgi:hypothetical protein